MLLLYIFAHNIYQKMQNLHYQNLRLKPLVIIAICKFRSVSSCKTQTQYMWCTLDIRQVLCPGMQHSYLCCNTAHCVQYRLSIHHTKCCKIYALDLQYNIVTLKVLHMVDIESVTCEDIKSVPYALKVLL